MKEPLHLFSLPFPQNESKASLLIEGKELRKFRLRCLNLTYLPGEGGGDGFSIIVIILRPIILETLNVLNYRAWYYP